MDSDTGPFLKAAVFCSDVIEGKDGVLSFIRVIDRLTATAGGQQPTEMPVVHQRMKLVLMFVSGRARGSHSVEIRIERPDSEVLRLWEGTIFLEGEDRGANIVVDQETTFELEGLYWFDLFFDGSLMTRMPFRVIYRRAGSATEQP